jgi:hypothetical protein
VFAFAPMFVLAAAGIGYALAPSPEPAAAIVVVEAVANAFLGPALFAILAIGTPTGRTATAQGLFGTAGTLAFMVSSVVAGALFALDPRYPFLFFTAAILATIVLAGAIWLARVLPRSAATPATAYRK